MSRKISAKLILKYLHNGYSYRDIVRAANVSNKSIKAVSERFKALAISYEEIEKMSSDEVYKLLFPDRYEDADMYYQEDYDYVHKELKKTGVTLKLLWQEYQAKIQGDKLAVSYSKYCEDYGRYVDTHDYVNHLEHKPGDKIEVDWSGKKMHFIDDYTGEVKDVYLFVACLPYSQYVYVEATLDMKMNSWINCNVHMFEYIGGITRRIICDNLKTGVISHPKEGDITLSEDYESLAEHYIVAIMPAGVRKPRHKPSAEGAVGKVAMSVIAPLRNREFRSFDELKKEVAICLEKFNSEPFQKRNGSRKEIFLKEEKPCLRTLPKASFELAEWAYGRKVMNDCHIVYAHNRYSVPYQYVGKLVDLKITSSTIEIYHHDQRISTHHKFPSTVKNKYETYDDDMPKSIRVSEWDDIRIKKWANKIGKNTCEVIERIFESVKIKEQAYNPSLSVLKISKKYGDDRLEKACMIALKHYRSPRYKHITAILANGLDLIDEKKETRQLSLFSRGPEYYKETK